MDERRTLDVTAYGSMLFLCLAMGLQSISVKMIGQEMAPIIQIALRSGLAALLLCLYIRLSGTHFAHLAKVWRPALLSGLFFALEYLFVGEALRFTTASRVTVFMYTSPLFSALILHFCKQSERLSLWQWGGCLITFSGVVAAFWKFTPHDDSATYPHMLFGDILALTGGILWALTTLVLRLSRLASTPQTITLLYQLVMTVVILSASALILKQTSFTLTASVALHIGYQTLFVAFGCMLLWLWLINNYAATRIGVLSFMTPLCTIVFAILLLDESVEFHFIIGAVLVVGGLIIISLSKNTNKKLEPIHEME